MNFVNHVQWAHSHHFDPNNQHNVTKVKLVFWLTLVVMVVEIISGIWFGSMALLADGWHMGTHAAAFLITLFAYAYANKHRTDRSFSFGTGKVNYLSGFASAIALGFVALLMLVESIQRLAEPQPISFNEAIVIAFIGLAVNLISVFVLQDKDHQHSHGIISKNDNDEHKHSHSHSHDHNIRAAYFHVLADTLTSVLAILALLLGKYFGWVWMDPIMGIVGAIIITRWSYVLIQQTSEVLLDRSNDQTLLNNVCEMINTIPHTNIIDIHLWTIAQSRHAIILSVTSVDPMTPTEYANRLQAQFPQLVHLSIEVNQLVKL